MWSERVQCKIEGIKSKTDDNQDEEHRKKSVLFLFLFKEHNPNCVNMGVAASGCVYETSEFRKIDGITRKEYYPEMLKQNC